jgi:hypothetical protein
LNFSQKLKVFIRAVLIETQPAPERTIPVNTSDQSSQTKPTLKYQRGDTFFLSEEGLVHFGTEKEF